MSCQHKIWRKLEGDLQIIRGQNYSKKVEGQKVQLSHQSNTPIKFTGGQQY